VGPWARFTAPSIQPAAVAMPARPGAGRGGISECGHASRPVRIVARRGAWSATELEAAAQDGTGIDLWIRACAGSVVAGRPVKDGLDGR
jgi:hypothetical protein